MILSINSHQIPHQLRPIRRPHRHSSHGREITSMGHKVNHDIPRNRLFIHINAPQCLARQRPATSTLILLPRHQQRVYVHGRRSRMEQTCRLSSQRPPRHKTIWRTTRHIFSATTLSLGSSSYDPRRRTTLASFPIHFPRSHRPVRSQPKPQAIRQQRKIRLRLFRNELDDVYGVFLGCDRYCGVGWKKEN